MQNKVYDYVYSQTDVIKIHIYYHPQGTLKTR